MKKIVYRKGYFLEGMFKVVSFHCCTIFYFYIFSNTPGVLDGHTSRVFAACFNPRSNHELITGGWDNVIQFWDARQPFAIRHIAGIHICGDGLDIHPKGTEVDFIYILEIFIFSRVDSRKGKSSSHK